MNNKTIGERIRAARKAKGLSQEQLGEKLDISFQAVSSWETGKFIPDSDHLPALAKALDISLDSLFAEEDRTWELKPVNYDFGHMFTFVKGRAQMLGLNQTLGVLDLLRKAHGGQERRSRHGFGTTYMVHPLTMASVNGRVREAVRLVSKNQYDPNEKDWEDRYYENILQDPLACLVKCLDRVNNLAGMADAFTRKRMAEYATETDRYYPALLDVIKKTPQWNDVWWLLRYQMMTMLEAFKRLL